jgi:hypothetical protein
MGIKNIYGRFVWFDHQVRVKKYPNANKIILGQPPKEVILFFLHWMTSQNKNGKRSGFLLRGLKIGKTFYSLHFTLCENRLSPNALPAYPCLPVGRGRQALSRLRRL